MSYKFIKVAFQKEMINVDDGSKKPDGSVKGLWFDCDPKAKTYAGHTFKAGEEVELVTEQRGDKAFVLQVRRPGQASAPAAAPIASPATTNQAPYTPAATTPAVEAPARSNYGQKSPEEAEKIIRQSTMASASRAAQMSTGQVPPEQVASYVIGIYRQLLAEVKAN